MVSLDLLHLHCHHCLLFDNGGIGRIAGLQAARGHYRREPRRRVLRLVSRLHKSKQLKVRALQHSVFSFSIVPELTYSQYARNKHRRSSYQILTQSRHRNRRHYSSLANPIGAPNAATHETKGLGHPPLCDGHCVSPLHVANNVVGRLTEI